MLVCEWCPQVVTCDLRRKAAHTKQDREKGNPGDWVTAAKVALAAGQAFKKYPDEQAAEETKKCDREELLEAIRTLTDDVIHTFVMQQIVDLKGDLDRFQDIYRSYDPGSRAEEERLRALIDESARVLGDLGQGLDARPLQEQLAFESYAIYVPLLFLRAQAMVERERTYGEKEVADIIPSFDLAIPRLRKLLEHLRAKSHAQFSEVIGHHNETTNAGDLSAGGSAAAFTHRQAVDNPPMASSAHHLLWLDQAAPAATQEILQPDPLRKVATYVTPRVPWGWVSG